MDTKKIGAFLKQCRKEKNLTQEQLAEKFGVSARTVSRWETGINMPMRPCGDFCTDAGVWKAAVAVYR